MTAEIAVMNKWGVALAADSKVTITGSGEAKAYDSVNKLFTLSKRHPVGAMIYSSAEFMEIPWETIIKKYREEKNGDSFPTIEEWTADFIAYVESFPKIDDHHKEENTRNVTFSVVSAMLEEAKIEALNNEEHVDSEAFYKAMAEYIDDQTELFDESDDWLSPDLVTEQLDKYEAVILEGFSGAMSPFSDEDLVRSMFRYLVGFLKSRKFSPRMSGVVIAGFGDDEMFPSLCELEVDGYVGDGLKLIKSNSQEITRDSSSFIKAFAQADMVQRFMNGVDSSLLHTIFFGFSDLITQTNLKVLEKFGKDEFQSKEVIEDLTDQTFQVYKEYFENVTNYIQVYFSQPVVSMVSLLPKEELAALAESLVALTSIKRRVSSEQETVGGPVDVALISKGDGFIWIKRKHYFDERLNHHFFKNYFPERNDG